MDYCPNCWREIHLTTIGFICQCCGYQVAFYDSESTTAGGMRETK